MFGRITYGTLPLGQGSVTVNAKFSANDLVWFKLNKIIEKKRMNKKRKRVTGGIKISPSNASP